jgi:RNA polymerase sigma-70 factor, ECF subfamily
MTPSVLHGDPDHERRFLDLIREHEARLRRISRIYGRADGSEDDLFQEILVQLWRTLPSFEGRSSIGTWLYRVALNTALSSRRRRETRRETSLDARDGSRKGKTALAVETRGASEPPADEAFETKEQLARLYAAIHQLPDADKALVMMYLDEHSHREMAEVLGITETNVGVKLHRLRKKLADWLAEEDR